jgi:hypothetical protein
MNTECVLRNSLDEDDEDDDGCKAENIRTECEVQETVKAQ